VAGGRRPAGRPAVYLVSIGTRGHALNTHIIRQPLPGARLKPHAVSPSSQPAKEPMFDLVILCVCFLLLLAAGCRCTSIPFLSDTPCVCISDALRAVSGLCHWLFVATKLPASKRRHSSMEPDEMMRRRRGHTVYDVIRRERVKQEQLRQLKSPVGPMCG